MRKSQEMKYNNDVKIFKNVMAYCDMHFLDDR